MNTIIKTSLGAILLLVISCKKQSTLKYSQITDKSSTPDVITGINDLGINSFIKIGTQKWMTKNLAVSRYRNGDKIPQVTDPAAWAALTTGAWCWYNNDSAIGAVYGRLYNWYAVHDPRGLAPIGWHVPSDLEWDTLSTFLGNNAGGKLKDTGTIEAGTGLWYAPNAGATNKTGFTGLPGGYRGGHSGAFDDFGGEGYWWTSTHYNASKARDRNLHYLDGHVGTYQYDKRYGFSVRCLRD